MRKGQQVGGYLGNKSSYDNENEYLLKANQMLHIHPHYEDFTDAKGKTLRVHNAIILEPHEYNHLSSHDEVKSIHRLNDILHEAKKSMDKKIDDDISQGKVDSNYINNNNYIFNNHHIDKLIKNPDLHDDLAYRHTLDKTHIDTMLAAGKVNPEYIVRQRNLTKEHIDKIMDMKNPILNSLLIRNKHIKLDKSIVDNFCKNKLYHRALSESNHITKEHIDHIIDANKDDYYNIYENLSKRSDLSEKNINDIADKQEKHFNENLIKNKDLSETNISKILDWGVDNYYMLSTQKNLNQAHISDILLKSRNSSNYSLSNIMQNHQLNDNNKNIVRNGSNFDDESKKLVDGLIPLPKRVENHPLTYPSL